MSICIVEALVFILFLEIMTNAIFSNNWSIVKVKRLCTDRKILQVSQEIFMWNFKSLALSV